MIIGKTTLKILSLAGLYSVLPFTMLASAGDLPSFLGQVKNILDKIIPILFVLATVVFLWGIVVFVTAAGDPAKVKEGRGLMLWGIIALAVMASIWGLSRILIATFVGSSTSIPTGF